ncbi:CGNR zinc finger domain-containing protein [Pseudonocardia sp. TRM90224]|uniref:CGNR zinc finger domain-containing protein n=1 Tax=Pseudonocardia sp. TRM90224 TaxID=2812678 RepID=UPI001E4297AD|nr:CGNR zinc finger domain-containing protein [Pseudonocardia sp. TRM90224]
MITVIELPARAELIRSFANTIDVEEGTDVLAEQATAAAWLAGKHLSAGPRLSADDHHDLLALRGGIRDALGADGASSPDARAAAERVLRSLPLHAGIDGDALASDGSAAARIAIAWVELRITGEVARLKRCPDDTCGWVFWDVSRNNSRRWCSMRVCGNRAKARAYSERQREAVPGGVG